jgi:hypothetical protein
MPRGIPIHLAASRLRAWATAGGLAPVFQGVLSDADSRIRARAIGTYMRDAKGEPLRRRSDDRGPLRIVTGDYVRGIARSPARIRMEGFRGVYEKRIDQARYPQSYNEMRRDGSPGKYPAHGPAGRDEAGPISRLAEKRIASAFARAMRGQASGGV